MKNYSIFGNKEVIENKIPISFTFGNFDGVHLGHQSLIKTINETAPNPLAVMTFDPHPANFFQPEQSKSFLTLQEQKINLLLSSGVDTVIVQKFTPSFALLSADEFCREFLDEYFNIQHVFLGYNLSYGKNRSGDFFHMQKIASSLNWKVHSLPAIEDSSAQIISSTSIRSALTSASPEHAEKLLGRPYSISGTVFRGDQRGRQLGFPTANINFEQNIVIPFFGVYKCIVEFPQKYPGKTFHGVMNCGLRPTLKSEVKRIQIETYIIDFDDDVYGEEVIFSIKSFIRKEQKFDSIELLKAQMHEDVLYAKRKYIL